MANEHLVTFSRPLSDEEMREIFRTGGAPPDPAPKSPWPWRLVDAEGNEVPEIWQRIVALMKWRGYTSTVRGSPLSFEQGALKVMDLIEKRSGKSFEQYT